METNQFWLNVSPAFSLDETGHCKHILPDKTLGVYVPNGKKSCCKNGDVLKCINPSYEHLQDVLCNVVYISFEQISEIMGIKRPDDIKEPIYVLSIDLCMKLCLEIGCCERFLFIKILKEMNNMSLRDIHHIWVYDAEYMIGNCPSDDTIFVYNPEGCEDVKIIPGDRVKCHNPVILSPIKICDVVELHKEQLSHVFIGDIENIKEPIYFISPNVSRHFGLDVDGDHLYIQKEEK